MGLGLQLYCGDNEDKTPVDNSGSDGTPFFTSYPYATTNYIGLMQPYLGRQNISLFTCPSAKLDSGTPTNSTSYHGNGVVMNIKLATIHHTSSIIFIQEHYSTRDHAFLRPYVDGGQFTYWHLKDVTQVLPGTFEHYTSIHQFGGNLIFVDGHVEYRKGVDLRSGDFGLSPADHTQQFGNGIHYTAVY
jgi:prepilin-type processing-associated H-X9-DG protein